MTPPQRGMIGVMQPSSDGPMLGLAEAAKACGVSVSTLRRKRGDLEELGATATPAGWRIPIAALVGTGLMSPTTPPPQQPSVTPITPPLERAGDGPRDTHWEELETLRSQLAAAEQRAAVAEAIAHERERVIETQATALRMLEASASTPNTTMRSASAAPVEPSPGQPQPPVKQSLWQRMWSGSTKRP